MSQEYPLPSFILTKCCRVFCLFSIFGALIANVYSVFTQIVTFNPLVLKMRKMKQKMMKIAQGYSYYLVDSSGTSWPSF